MNQHEINLDIVAALERTCTIFEAITATLEQQDKRIKELEASVAKLQGDRS